MFRPFAQAKWGGVCWSLSTFAKPSFSSSSSPFFPLRTPASRSLATLSRPHSLLFPHSTPAAPSSRFPQGLSCLTQVREYRSNQAIDFVRIKQRARAVRQIEQRVKVKNHGGIMDRFMLTRFGWTRRRAGLRAKRRRLISNKAKKKSREIEFVHRVDIRKIGRVVPGYKLKLRDPPRDSNPNLMPKRHLFPARFG